MKSGQKSTTFFSAWSQPASSPGMEWKQAISFFRSERPGINVLSLEIFTEKVEINGDFLFQIQPFMQKNENNIDFLKKRLFFSRK
jgi:hypothetical protein